jgi:hypothetical protein
VSRVMKIACLLVRYLQMDALLLLRANFGDVFTDPLPSNGHMRHNNNYNNNNDVTSIIYWRFSYVHAVLHLLTLCFHVT